MNAKKKTKDSYKIPLQEIEFVCEQDGLAERELKAALLEVFACDKGIEKAYLARVSYRCSDEYLVALCLSIVSGHESSKVKKISKCFSRIFGKGQHLEILFLSPELESQVNTVCTPFYTKKCKNKEKPDF